MMSELRVFRTRVPILSLSDPFLENQDGSPAARGAQNILAVPPDARDGSVWRWSFDIQREMPKTKHSYHVLVTMSIFFTPDLCPSGRTKEPAKSRPFLN